jgi:hypothetical protein
MTDESGTGKGESGGMASEGPGEAACEIKKTFEWRGAVPVGVVCPACLGELSAGAEMLVCAVCGRRYPAVDGIPVLIVERAERG